MSLTEQQKAYHLRKMRTRVARLDVNKDGVVSREDFQLMSERLSEYSHLTEQKAKAVNEALMHVADRLHLTPGVKHSLKEMAQKISENMLSRSPALMRKSHDPLFDAIDTNGDGHISVEEYKIYLRVVAPEVTGDEAKHAFDVIDADKNGEISREEFLAAATDFFFGVEETEAANVFMGKLVD